MTKNIQFAIQILSIVALTGAFMGINAMAETKCDLDGLKSTPAVSKDGCEAVGAKPIYYDDKYVCVVDLICLKKSVRALVPYEKTKVKPIDHALSTLTFRVKRVGSLSYKN